ncbi:hypothetical protein QA612_09350 [Evansella sp. AB-P1]|uniref:hypothetical protein n=1 Tax=Evansella sp. AB-P1 TaxID=3037653 RepID=UPI00241E859B|nr:hypothetical protein [Evansella sp. AB-P1]MDG5787703.1 hypothetical protein [Evansella sp. AB-P1]
MKPFQRQLKDHDIKKLDNDIVWKNERQHHVHSKVMNDIHDIGSKKKGKVSYLYAASIALFLMFVFVGYSLITQEERSLSPENSLPILDREREEIDENLPEKNDHFLTYNGTYDETNEYYSIGLTDERYRYLIQGSVPNVNIDVVQQINFNATEEMNQEFIFTYGLRTAWSGLHMEDFRVIDDHLQLDFYEEGLLEFRGSTGVRMGVFSVDAFAANFRWQADHYTAYGDGVPFYHSGEDFHLENRQIQSNRFFFPVTTDKSIFLAQEIHVHESEEELFDAFFSEHRAPDGDQELMVNLSMLSFNYVERNEEQTIIYLEGDMEEVNEQNEKIKEESMKKLIAHGVGMNILWNPELLQISDEEVKIMLNNEVIFEGMLSNIRFNMIDWLEDNSKQEEKIIATIGNVMTFEGNMNEDLKDILTNEQLMIEVATIEGVQEDPIIEFHYNDSIYKLYESVNIIMIDDYYYEVIGEQTYTDLLSLTFATLDDLKTMQLHGNDYVLRFSDHDQEVELTNEERELLEESFSLAEEHDSQFYGFPYPGASILVDSILNIELYEDKEIWIWMDGFLSKSFQIDSAVYELLQANYRDMFERRGIFDSYELSVTLPEYDNEVIMDNWNYRNDSLLRLFDFESEQVNGNNIEILKEMDKIEIKLDNDLNRMIIIYENDYWLYDGTYYIQENIFETFVNNMLAG